MTTTARRGTCNVACWQAKEPECNCQCDGRNHGIMLKGGSPPQRVTQRTTGVYDLVAITNIWAEARNAAEEAQIERGFLPNWRNPPTLIERANARTLKWPEVQAVQAQSSTPYPSTWLVWVKEKE